MRALGQLELLRGVACARGAALATQPTHRPAAPQPGDRPLPRPPSAEGPPLVEQCRPVRITLEEPVLLTCGEGCSWGDEGKTQPASLYQSRSSSRGGGRVTPGGGEVTFGGEGMTLVVGRLRRQWRGEGGEGGNGGGGCEGGGGRGAEARRCGSSGGEGVVSLER